MGLLHLARVKIDILILCCLAALIPLCFIHQPRKMCASPLTTLVTHLHNINQSVNPLQTVTGPTFLTCLSTINKFHCRVVEAAHGYHFNILDIFRVFAKAKFLLLVPLILYNGAASS